MELLAEPILAGVVEPAGAQAHAIFIERGAARAQGRAAIVGLADDRAALVGIIPGARRPAGLDEIGRQRLVDPRPEHVAAGPAAAQSLEGLIQSPASPVQCANLSSKKDLR